MPSQGAKLDDLKSGILRTGPLAVAFSGGVDSAFLLAVARETLGGGGVLAVTVVYRDDDGVKQSFTHELPLSFDTEARGTLLLPRIRAYDAVLSGSGRTVSANVTLTVEAEWYRTVVFSHVPELSAGTPCETNCGMLVWFADANETLFSIGKRFRVPTARVRASNPTLCEPIAEGTPVLLIRAT